jgi:hypothetical protein
MGWAWQERREDEEDHGEHEVDVTDVRGSWGTKVGLRCTDLTRRLYEGPRAGLGSGG